ncbi:MAG: prepilin-type N-terminal cleavage/methylation domain-containing protein [Turicibacter sp.]|nr:prepilin-type N-terminal cleavage/methylation domain-containing protein [Turicibacter sp.]
MKNGFTLIELTVAIALWMLLFIGIGQILIYTARVSSATVEQNQALENARAAVDALTAQIQMADVVIHHTHTNGELMLVLWQIEPNTNQSNDFIFSFNRNATSGTQFRRLNLGGRCNTSVHCDNTSCDCSSAGNSCTSCHPYYSCVLNPNSYHQIRQELARHILDVQVNISENKEFATILVKAGVDGGEPVILTSAVDLRHKIVVQN